MIEIENTSFLKSERLDTADIRIDKKSLKNGINKIGDHFIMYHDEKVVFVVNNICDHNAGRLIQKGENAVCPLHGWVLNLTTLKYDNEIEKTKLKFTEDSEFIYVENVQESIEFPSLFRNIHPCQIDFISHACIRILFNGVSIITDPWLIGSAFMNGWWLKYPPKEDAIDMLKSADIIYISHNHPDHLHVETLKEYVSQDQLIVTANFKSKSSEKVLRHAGFNNIIPLDFKNVYKVKNVDIQFSVLKSGDFRDDSGLYLNVGNKKLLLTVDSNYINSFSLPQNLDVLFTSFAAGASGFPVCFEDYSKEEIDKVIQRNKNAILVKNMDIIGLTTPKIYYPYAGFFTESAARDNIIKEANDKNSVERVRNFINKKYADIKVIDPIKNDTLVLGNDSLLYSRDCKRIYNTDHSYTENYINNYKSGYKENTESVKKYFEQSGFKDNLILVLQLTNDNFEQIGANYIIDFSAASPNIEQVHLDCIPPLMSNPDMDKRILRIKVRTESLMCVIDNFLPWEDLSIGFQCRISRIPNVYNQDFWYHFTNIYIAKKNFRYSAYCGACNVLDQNPKYIH
ncbi:MBL fold metallo-hydrolase [Reichenbachiella carrageenanivorans]|uniref:Cytidine monophosphate-N-acetylneuraminic acid hydroxylase n=1 Tax=Reichenbachiella carrageenanivorans TaxID=2979869 RepID=A0ABY6D3A4_9BACT|nr:MBL fold metallo-hydrolase [Reichenbachiella carrageenanivorans]UXX80603.1 MBL fold metallo-hydrolase [Reichenbachiella carrageenanivorans]